jgi:hypothetical protein
VNTVRSVSLEFPDWLEWLECRLMAHAQASALRMLPSAAAVPVVHKREGAGHFVHGSTCPIKSNPAVMVCHSELGGVCLLGALIIERITT